MNARIETDPVVLPGVRLGVLIGEGVFARVYEGWLDSGERVAVKLLWSSDPGAERRFLREIQVLRALPKSRHVVGYRGHGRSSDGRPWLAMEYVDGFTLAAAIAAGEPLAEEKACRLMLQICQSLGGLHRLGIAHRDIKPENIMIADGGRVVKLLDFGLVSDAQGLLRLFEQQQILPGNEFADDIDHGVLAGTPEYMAPEQITDAHLGDPAEHKLDTTGDVFSLGVLFYQLLCGHTPYPFLLAEGDESSYKAQLLAYLERRREATDDELPEILAVTPALWSVLRKALRSDPKRRQGDSIALYDDIARYVTSGDGVDDGDVDFSSTLATDLRVVDRLLAERALALQSEAPRGTPARAEPSPSGFKMALLGVGIAVSVWLLVLLAGLF
jgi:serine/threonine protein kinase